MSLFENKERPYNWFRFFIFLLALCAIIEMTLPKSIQVRYAYSSKLYVKSKLEVTGGSYTLVEETIEGYNRLEIRQSEISLSLKVEREIHDWLWIAARTGLLYSYKMNIVEPDLFNDKELVTTDPFTNYFIVTFNCLM